MKRNTALFCILSFLFSELCWSQESFTLSGTVKEAASNESMINANVYFPDLQVGVSANKYGFYSIKVPAGEHTVKVSSVGYQDYVVILDLTNNLKQDFYLEIFVENLDIAPLHSILLVFYTFLSHLI